MASCCKCGKTAAAMPVICGECLGKLSEVTRCIDCVYYFYSAKTGNGTCLKLMGLSGILKPTEFCSKGIKKGGKGR